MVYGAESAQLHHFSMQFRPLHYSHVIVGRNRLPEFAMTRRNKIIIASFIAILIFGFAVASVVDSNRRERANQIAEQGEPTCMEPELTMLNTGEGASLDQIPVSGCRSKGSCCWAWVQSRL